MKGQPPGDLIPLQQALAHIRLYSGAIDDVFGAGTGQACKSAWYRLGAPLASCTPHGDQDLLNLLRGTTPLPPLWILRRHARGFGISTNDRIRDKIVSHAKWAAANEPSIHYAQYRPMDHLNKVRALPWTTDCSEFVTTIYHWSGAPDPNGMGYNGYGYTGTLLERGTPVAIYQVRRGDLVIWGAFPGHHTAVFVEDANSSHIDPWIVSHGSERGPLELRLSSENRAQGGRPMSFRRYISD